MPELVDDRPAHRRHLLGVGDVGLEHERLAAHALDVVRHRPGLVDALQVDDRRRRHPRPPWPRAYAAPIPCAAPVTMHTLSCSRSPTCSPLHPGNAPRLGLDRATIHLTFSGRPPSHVTPGATRETHMPTRPVRVAVWSTGGIGSIAIRAVDRRPDLELVGVWVHSPEKVGRDAGELAGGDPIGVTATDDMNAILAEGVDCVVYAAQGPEQDAGSVPDYVRLLSAGVNVVTTSSWALLYPPTYEPTWRAQLEAAAADGGGVAVRLGHRTGLRGRPAADPAHDDVEHDPVDPLVGDRHVRHLPGDVHDDGRHGLRPSARPRRHARTPGIDPLGVGARHQPDRLGARRRARRDPRGVRPRGQRPHLRGRVRHHRGRHRAARSARRRSAWSTVATRSSSST